MELTANSQLRATSRAALSGHWTNMALTMFVWILISTAVCIIPVANLLLLPVLEFGILTSFIGLVRVGTEPRIEDAFNGFRNYGVILGGMLLMMVYIFLWCLLLYIPGIIKAYSYGMTPYILREEPELGANGAIERSMEMMKGHKMKLFLLDLSFLGWILLSMLTFGIALLWVYPYMMGARAGFYEDLKRAEQATLEA